jgi:hypothetical protein
MILKRGPQQSVAVCKSPTSKRASHELNRQRCCPKKSLPGANWRAITAAGYFVTSVSLFASSAMDHPYRAALFCLGIVFIVIGTALVICTYQKTRI